MVSAFFVGVGVAVAVYESVRRRRSARPQLTIEGGPCFIPGARRDPAHPFYCFDIVNPGESAVTLNNIQIGLRNGKSLAYPWGRIKGDRPLPCKLEPLEAAHYWIELEPLQKQLRRMGYSGEAQVALRAHGVLGDVYEAQATIDLELR